MKEENLTNFETSRPLVAPVVPDDSARTELGLFNQRTGEKKKIEKVETEPYKAKEIDDKFEDNGLEEKMRKQKEEHAKLLED